jgi:GNAT superfamily N-acetyltransferase
MNTPQSSYVISEDVALLEIETIHDFLRESYWSPGIPREVVERAIRGSLCFGVHRAGRQVGFARVITDRATFAYLADVFILPAHRGQGLSKRLLAHIAAHPDLQGLRRFMLATRDGHGLYAQFGFQPVGQPDRLMEILRPDVYRASARAPTDG